MVMELLVKETLGWLGKACQQEEMGRRLEWSARHSGCLSHGRGSSIT